MSKRYRNGFKRTLCRWTVSTPSTSYRNARSNVYKNNNNSSPLSPTLACTNNIRHQRLTYPTKGKKSGQIHKSFFRSRDNVLMFSMSKYKFVIGSRTNTGHTSVPSHPHPRTSLHYRFSLVEQQEREQQQQQQQQQLQIQLQPRKVLLQSYVYIP
ncbi:unnamed protein product [Rotaria magnacalcarata]|nr:unnamed protein product [Rotaria magnacalcarata]